MTSKEFVEKWCELEKPLCKENRWGALVDLERMLLAASEEGYGDAMKHVRSLARKKRKAKR